MFKIGVNSVLRKSYDGRAGVTLVLDMMVYHLSSLDVNVSIVHGNDSEPRATRLWSTR